MNAILAIHPYKYEGLWVFDDAKVGLAQEPTTRGLKPKPNVVFVEKRPPPGQMNDLERVPIHWPMETVRPVEPEGSSQPAFNRSGIANSPASP